MLRVRARFLVRAPCEGAGIEGLREVHSSHCDPRKFVIGVGVEEAG